MTTIVSDEMVEAGARDISEHDWPVSFKGTKAEWVEDTWKMNIDRARSILTAALSIRQGGVKALEWHKSDVHPWNGDCHTFPQNYAIRETDEYGWKWESLLGPWGYEPSLALAKAAAQADFNTRILSVLEVTP